MKPLLPILALFHFGCAHREPSQLQRLQATTLSTSKIPYDLKMAEPRQPAFRAIAAVYVAPRDDLPPGVIWVQEYSTMKDGTLYPRIAYYRAEMKPCGCCVRYVPWNPEETTP